MGVIDSLSAGYRFLNRRPWLVLLPILLDLLFWWGPRVSLAPLYSRVAGFYTEMAGAPELPAEMTADVTQVAALLESMGSGSNMLTLLSGGLLLHVPSLLAVLGPVGQGGRVLAVETPLGAAGYFVLFGLMGLWVGVLFLGLLARRLPIGGGLKAASGGEFLRATAAGAGKVLLFTLLTVMALLALYIPIGLLVAIMTLVSPGLGSALAVGAGGLTLAVFFYLYFVTPGIVMDGLGVRAAVAQSFRLVRAQFWSILGFVLLTNVISVGFALILSRMAGGAPAGTLLAIVLHAYIGTGLTMALLVFYRTRVLRLAGDAPAMELE